MKATKMRIGHPNEIKIGEKVSYETLSFIEEQSIKKIKLSSNVPQQPRPEKGNNDLSDAKSSPLKTILIVGGIIAGLILVVLAFYFWKKKGSLKK